MTTVRLLVAISLLAAGPVACNRGEPQGAAGPGAMPPTEVKTITLAAKPVPQTSEFIALDPLAALDDRAAAGRGHRPADLREGRRPRARRASRSCRSTRRSSRRPSRRFRVDAGRARGGSGLREAATAIACRRCSRRARSAARNSSRPRRPTRPPQAQLKAVDVADPGEPGRAAVLPRDGAGRRASSGEIPVRQGDRVTPSTEHHHDRRGRGARGVRRRAARARDRPARRPAGRTARTPTARVGRHQSRSRSSRPRADDKTQIGAGEGHAAQRAAGHARRCSTSVRASSGAASRRSRCRSWPSTASAGSTSSSSPQPGKGGTVAKQTPVTVGEVVGEDYVVRGGLQAGQQVIVSNVQKLGDGAPVTPAGS